eukprot:scaffold1269_cov85-Phaeocystis_antarctica.AAC.1
MQVATLTPAQKTHVASLTVLISVVVSGTNFLLRELLYKLAAYERSATSTEQQMRLFTLATCVQHRLATLAPAPPPHTCIAS